MFSSTTTNAQSTLSREPRRNQRQDIACYKELVGWGIKDVGANSQSRQCVFDGLFLLDFTRFFLDQHVRFESIMDRGEGSSRNPDNETSEILGKKRNHLSGAARRAEKRRRAKTTGDGNTSASQSKASSQPQSRTRTPSPEIEMIYFVDCKPDELDPALIPGVSLPKALQRSDSDDDVVEIENPILKSTNGNDGVKVEAMKAPDALLLPSHVKLASADDEVGGKVELHLALEDDEDEDDFIDYMDEDIQKVRRHVILAQPSWYTAIQ